ncbi:MAG TPA: anti-sigma B factor RsbW [Metalysinibacillus jejuensis]|uniref:Serine-protein kinase RsbW n=1 Tax=Metalysinibacillus jejuensis TaxID=914327 RepID=A0A921NCK5_9BACL|nr:anti-sigma B factor RsbW [Metalysinibacillus jejuensis]HJH11400.1 anti-sigma B factor RsbW [Metalysinibacillus jejuensis]
MTKPFDYVEMKFPAKSQYVSVIRLTVSSLASRIGFSYDDIEDLKIAVSEAVTNVVHHAYEGAGEMVIGCAMYEEKIELMISDYGSSFEYETVKSTVGPYHNEQSIENLREGGLGLYLMDALMDEVLLANNDSGVTVFMTKYIAREQVDEVAEKVTTQ